MHAYILLKYIDIFFHLSTPCKALTKETGWLVSFPNIYKLSLYPFTQSNMKHKSNMIYICKETFYCFNKNKHSLNVLHCVFSAQQRLIPFKMCCPPLTEAASCRTTDRRLTGPVDLVVTSFILVSFFRLKNQSLLSCKKPLKGMPTWFYCMFGWRKMNREQQPGAVLTDWPWV